MKQRSLNSCDKLLFADWRDNLDQFLLSSPTGRTSSTRCGWIIQQQQMLVSNEMNWFMALLTDTGVGRVVRCETVLSVTAVTTSFERRLSHRVRQNIHKQRTPQL